MTNEPPTPLAAPTTRAGQAHVAFWLAGRTHPPSTQRLADFIEHVRATEAEARDATGLREALDDLYRALVSEHGHKETDGAPWPSCLPVHIAMNRYRAALAAAPPQPRWPSRDELAKALMVTDDALFDGDELVGEYNAYQHADAILAALREGGER